MLLSSGRNLAFRSRSAACPARAIAARPSRIVMRAAATDIESKKKEEIKAVEPAREVEDDLPDVQPSTKEVEKFLGVLVNETSIAELNLQVGSFKLKVRRSTNGAAAAAAQAAAAAAPAAPIPTATTLVISHPEHSHAESAKTLEESVDESLVQVMSPKVGVFRRGKYAGGKRVGKSNAANQGDQVKRGQVLGYVEQLGTFVAVESPQAGELVSFFVDEGSPVEYKQAVVEIAPFFGGHIVEKYE